jgi:hypothetical protein
MLVSIIAIMTLQYVLIYECCFDCGLICFSSTPIWVPYGAVVLFGTTCCDVPYCLFLCFLVWFSLFYAFIHLSCFQRLASLCVRLQLVISSSFPHLHACCTRKPVIPRTVIFTSCRTSLFPEYSEGDTTHVELPPHFLHPSPQRSTWVGGPRA